VEEGDLSVINTFDDGVVLLSSLSSGGGVELLNFGTLNSSENSHLAN